MVFDKIQSLCPDHFCCHSRKLHKEQFLLSYSHLTTSTVVTICLGINMADSNRRQGKAKSRGWKRRIRFVPHTEVSQHKEGKCSFKPYSISRFCAQSSCCCCFANFVYNGWRSGGKYIDLAISPILSMADIFAKWETIATVNEIGCLSEKSSFARYF